MREISQKTLGDRNPKPAQLLKIVKALGVRIYVFMDFDIATTSDVLTQLFKIDEQIHLSFDRKADKDGQINPDMLTIHFNIRNLTKGLRNGHTLKTVRWIEITQR